MKINKLLALSILLGGCAGVPIATTIGAIGTTGSMSTDNRTIGEQIDNSIIEVKITSALYKNKKIKDENISIYPVGDTIFIIGPMLSENMKSEVLKTISLTAPDYDIIDMMIVTDYNAANYFSDAKVTAKVKAALISNKNGHFSGIGVETFMDKVYLFGKADNFKQYDSIQKISEKSGQLPVDNNIIIKD